MSNTHFGILTIAFCLIGYFMSCKFWLKENYKFAILLLLLCGLVLRIYTSSDFFLHNWDERYHALVAKNLLKHFFTPTLYDNPVIPYDYKNWTANHIWVHKQPLPLWSMAASMSVFGVNEIALRLPSIVLTTIGIWLTFYIGSYISGKKVGFLAAFLYSINGLIIEMTGGRWATDHIDIFFLFFVELAVFFCILFVKRKKTIYNVLVGLSIGAAILSKWLPALIVLPIWLFILIDSKYFKPKTIVIQGIIMIVSCIIVFVPWQIYIFSNFPIEASWEASFNFKHITEALDGQSGPFYYFIDRIRINYGELVYLPVLWFLWKTFKNYYNLKFLALTIWFLVPLLFFSFVKTKMQAYILFTSPAIFIITSEFWFMLYDYSQKHKYKWFFNLLLFLLIALPIRYTIERTKPFTNIDRKPLWVCDLRELNTKKIKNGILFNYDKPIEAMFYTNLTAYQCIPEKSILTNLLDKGYTVLIKDGENIPDEIRNFKNFKIMKMH